MEIQISSHALSRAWERGVTEKEIREVLETGMSALASKNRLAKEKVFQFEQILNHKFFHQKKVTVVYVIEDSIIVITVIAKYGSFNDSFI